MIHLPRLPRLPRLPIQQTADFESYQDRRQFLGTAAMGIVSASAASLLSAQPASAVESGAIRPFRINVPEAQLVDLRRRVKATSGRTGKRSRIDHRAYSSRQHKDLRVIGRRNTTRARSRRS